MTGGKLLAIDDLPTWPFRLVAALFYALTALFALGGAVALAFYIYARHSLVGNVYGEFVPFGEQLAETAAMSMLHASFALVVVALFLAALRLRNGYGLTLLAVGLVAALLVGWHSTLFHAAYPVDCKYIADCTVRGTVDRQLHDAYQRDVLPLGVNATRRQQWNKMQNELQCCTRYVKNDTLLTPPSSPKSLHHDVLVPTKNVFYDCPAGLVPEATVECAEAYARDMMRYKTLFQTIDDFVRVIGTLLPMAAFFYLAMKHDDWLDKGADSLDRIAQLVHTAQQHDVQNPDPTTTMMPRLYLQVAKEYGVSEWRARQLVRRAEERLMLGTARTDALHDETRTGLLPTMERRSRSRYMEFCDWLDRVASGPQSFRIVYFVVALFLLGQLYTFVTSGWHRAYLRQLNACQAQCGSAADGATLW